MRLIKVVCDQASHGYALWTTRVWLDRGTPDLPVWKQDVRNDEKGSDASMNSPTVISNCIAGEIAYVSLSGRLVAGREVAALREVILRAGPHYGLLVLNLRELVKIDAAGISALLFAHTTAESLGARFKLAAVPDRIQKLLMITCLDAVLSYSAADSTRDS